jgi:uncharacterized protein (DUF983 family)
VTLDEPQSWSCPECDHQINLTSSSEVKPEGTFISRCAVCGNGELYKKKDFPHWLGIAILVFACVGFMVLHLYRETIWAWVVLIGSALVDGALYLAVKDVVVCYNCDTEHRGMRRAANAPFELTIHERYRQQKLRQQQLKD